MFKVTNNQSYIKNEIEKASIMGYEANKKHIMKSVLSEEMAEN